MILPAQMIRQRCDDTNRMVSPFHERTEHNNLTFGLSPAGYDVRISETIFLYPGVFVLSATIEHFDMPLDVLAIVHDKSTWARRGLAVQNTVIEPGWRGYLTLELSNHGADMLHIKEGDPIAQIIFHSLVSPTQQPYEGRYQDQEVGPQPARAFKNK